MLRLMKSTPLFLIASILTVFALPAAGAAQQAATDPRWRPWLEC